MKSFRVLSVRIDALRYEEVLSFIKDAIENSRKVQIATVNNEFIVEAQKNKKFALVLDSCSLCLPDSAGIVWAINKIYKEKILKTPGADLFNKICSLAKNKDFGIFLLGGRKGVGEISKAKLTKEYVGLNIVGSIDGIIVDPSNCQENIINTINESRAEIVFVALGAPKQELWISNNLSRLNPHVFIGIGGTLDFISGKIKRAPSWARKLNLEWLFRLIQEPKRFGRIVRAVIVFPYLILRSKSKR